MPSSQRFMRHGTRAMFRRTVPLRARSQALFGTCREQRRDRRFLLGERLRHGSVWSGVCFPEPGRNPQSCCPVSSGRYCIRGCGRPYSALAQGCRQRPDCRAAGGGLRVSGSRHRRHGSCGEIQALIGSAQSGGLGSARQLSGEAGKPCPLAIASCRLHPEQGRSRRWPGRVRSRSRTHGRLLRMLLVRCRVCLGESAATLAGLSSSRVRALWRCARRPVRTPSVRPR